jgi:hypothetical protein
MKRGDMYERRQAGIRGRRMLQADQPPPVPDSTALLVLTCLTLPNTDASMPTSDRTASRLRPALPVPASMRVL